MQKHKNHVKKYHHKKIAGAIIALLALTITAAAQLSGVNTAHFSTEVMDTAAMQAGCTSAGGTWNGTMCDMPGMNSGSSTSSGSTWSNSGSSSSQGASTYVSESSCVGAAYFWSSTVNRCFATQADKSAAEWSNGSSNPGSYTPQGASSYVSESSCSGAAYFWSSSIGRCFATQADKTSAEWNSGSSSNSNSNSSTWNNSTWNTNQNWPTVQVTWNNLGLQSMVCSNAPQSAIDAAKKAVANAKMQDVTWPNPTDCTRPETAGIPVLGNSSTTTMPSMSAEEGCKRANGSWDSANYYCKMPNMPVDKVDDCKARGMGWDAANSKCIENKKNDEEVNNNIMKKNAKMEEQCKKSGGKWSAGPTSTATGWCEMPQPMKEEKHRDDFNEEFKQEFKQDFDQEARQGEDDNRYQGEVQRMDREVNKMEQESTRVKDVATKAKLAKILTQIRAIDLAKVKEAAGCETGYCDPLQDYFNLVDPLREQFWDTMQNQYESFREDDVCAKFDGIREDMAREGKDVPPELLKKAAGLLDRGMAYCKEGDVEGASKILEQMWKLGEEYDRTKGHGKKSQAFGELDVKTTLRESLGEDLSDEMLAKIDQIISSKLSVAMDTLNQQFAVKIAEMESRYADKVATMQKTSLANLNAGFSGKTRDEMIQTKTDLADSVGSFDKVIDGVKIPESTAKQLEEVYQYATVRNFTNDAAREVQAEIDSLSTEVSEAADSNEAGEILKEKSPKVLAALKKAYEGDRDAQIEKGILKFNDLFGKEAEWYTGDINSGADLGIIKGKTNADGSRTADPSANTSWADALTMVARTSAGGEDNIPNEVDLNNPIVSQMPDYARAPVTYLIGRGFISPEELNAIYAKNKPGEAITRIEMMQIVSDVFDVGGGDDSVISQFSDAGKLDTVAKEAAAALIGAGIVNGEGSGNLNPDGNLNRAAFAKIMNLTHEQFSTTEAE
ncbi:MAG: S-layer homology domain-containing protein [Patescibacteria group bacterium]